MAGCTFTKAHWLEHSSQLNMVAWLLEMILVLAVILRDREDLTLH